MKTTQSKAKKGRIVQKKQAAKPDGQREGGTRPPKRYKKRLKSLPDVRVYLSELIHATRSGEVDANLAGKLAFMLNILRGVIADSELADRIEQLEKEMEKRDKS